MGLQIDRLGLFSASPLGVDPVTQRLAVHTEPVSDTRDRAVLTILDYEPDRALMMALAESPRSRSPKFLRWGRVGGGRIVTQRDRLS